MVWRLELLAVCLDPIGPHVRLHISTLHKPTYNMISWVHLGAKAAEASMYSVRKKQVSVSRLAPKNSTRSGCRRVDNVLSARSQRSQEARKLSCLRVGAGMCWPDLMQQLVPRNLNLSTVPGISTRVNCRGCPCKSRTPSISRAYPLAALADFESNRAAVESLASSWRRVLRPEALGQASITIATSQLQRLIESHLTSFTVFATTWHFPMAKD